MKRTQMLTILVLALCLMVWPVEVSEAQWPPEPMGSAFTYQGHLYDANHVANGEYDFKFDLWMDPCSSEPAYKIGDPVTIHNLDVIDGYFTVVLDFNHPYAFGGFAHWLEIGVRPGDQNDPNTYRTLSPRQEITPTPYAINADKLDGASSSSFAWATHTHSGSDVTSGTVAEGYIDGLITRDSEIMSWVLAGDGPGSGLDADLLDGQNSGDFAPVSHSHNGSDITSGTVAQGYIDGLIARDSEIMSWVLAGDGSGSGLDADLLDGQNSGDFAPVSHSHDSVYALVTHNHDDRYYTEAQSDSRFVNTTGDSMNGSSSGSLLSVSNAGSGYGIYGEAAGGYRGVYGAATSTGYLINYGGYFTAAGNYGQAVYGEAPVSGNYDNYGGYFTAAGSYGRGVYGECSNPNDVTNYGGYFTAAGQQGIGVYGAASNPNEPTNYGGFFEAAGKFGNAGYFNATGTNSTGIVASGGLYAAQFVGDVLITFGRVTTPVLEITGGADVSEQFEITTVRADVLPSAGMVVSIDPQNPGALVVSDKAYDRRVAGIISGAGDVKPGMLMGQKGTRADGEHPVALTGRVYCSADASNGSIEPGDLLTSSDTAGHAMKVTNYDKANGAVLGKAMSSLKEGQGLVLVLVNLQ